MSLYGQPHIITIDASNPDITISRHIYGHFAEHLGRCIYGGFYVGEGNKTIPHTNGVRNDVVDALKKLKIPNLRWPGGCFADTYRWKDGIGPKEKRPAMINMWWGGVSEDNSFGTHDFLNMCELLGAEPYIAANVGSGTVKDLVAWVEYVNYPTGAPMADRRHENGRSEPWDVKYWGIGNEVWGCGGHMRPEYYADLYRQYATFIQSGLPTNKLFRIASGANSSDYHWTDTLMKNIPLHLLEGVALHHYAVIDWNKKGPATGFTDEQYFTTMKRAAFMEELVTKHSEIMDHYDPKKKVALVVDEWGGWYDVEPGTNPGFLYQQNTMRDAMIAAITLNVFNNHADRVRMANLAQTVNVLQAVILTNEDQIVLTPTYHVMEMYTIHHDANLLPLKVPAVDYRFGNETLQAISASASVDKSGVTHISIVNIDPMRTYEIALEINGKSYSKVSGRILQSQSMQDHNTFEDQTKVRPAPFSDADIKGEKVITKITAGSVLVLELR